ncbi:heptosyltransferase [Patiriisocius marinistellae]|uniref:Heptosyltransferase n=1 Tax=Patiriisocius marinistellae TaxID=2494560 RepID=A0A5J4FUK7_9FLAO|nr:glycosyltransferase family 9 protein [Patiriisocius marinistellae]GEQ84838.1 heptosyltransferase [Patiriisocius marinistellae]
MSKPKHILAIRLSAMGDVAMLVPVLRVVTQTYPDLKITVLTKSFFKPFFSEILNVSTLDADVYGKHKGIVGLFKLSTEANKLGIDAVADTHNVLRSKVLRFLLWLRQNKTASIDKGRAQKKELIQANGALIKPLKKTHQRYADVFEKLGFPIDLNKQKFPGRHRLTPLLQELVGAHPKKLIGIAPFAAHDGKMYRLSLMKEVIEDLNATNRFKIFLFGGGKKEVSQLDDIAQEFESVINVAGVLSFEDELKLISNLDVMLAMDSGNGHLAAMYGLPVITLWGVTHPYAGFVPFNQPNANQLIADRDQFPLIPTSIYGNKYPAGYDKAMNTIPVTTVVEKVLGVL